MLNLNNITKRYGEKFIFKNMNIQFDNTNEINGIIGKSGSGKSTLFNILFGLDTDYEGTYKIENKDVKSFNNNQWDKIRKEDIHIVFQDFKLIDNFTVLENLLLTLNCKEDIARSALKKLDILKLENTKVKNISGGEKQRLALARAIIGNPKVLLLDEPLGALDLKLRKEMQYELKRIQQEVGITFIYVTHDQEEALTMSDKIVIMKGGEIQQVGTPQEIYNEPVNKYVANFIGESNVISGIMVEDYKVKFDDQIFDCVDFGFKPNEKVDVVLRPEDIDIVPLEQGKITGEVLSVLFKGVWNEAMVETVPGTTVKVNMNVIKNHDVESEYSDERISANDFYVDIEEVASLDDNDLIARADAQAWKESDDSYISISKIEHNLKEELGEYTVTFQTSSGLSVSRKIIVVDQKYVKNEKANEAVSAFNFFKTVDEIKESVALDTDLKTWANAIGWKLSNEDEAVDIYVDYDFDPENIKEGIYQVTFSTEGRELKVHTTDYVEEGQEVGLTFEVEDIHVMEKMGF